VTEGTKAPRRSRADRILLAFELPAVLALFAMMIQVSWNSISRFLFDNPVFATLEMTQFWYMPVISLFGFVAAQARREHVAADILFNRFGPVSKRVVAVLGFTVSAACTLGLAAYGFIEARENQEIGLTAGFLGEIPVWPLTYLVTISFGILTIQFLYAAVQSARGNLKILEPAEESVA